MIAKYINSHGTLVAKIITDNLPKNINLKLMDLRIFDKKNKTNLFSVVCAIDYARQNNAHIINMSWGAFFDHDSIFSDLLFLNVPMVASAGNNGFNTDSKWYPNLLSIRNARSGFCCGTR